MWCSRFEVWGQLALIGRAVASAGGSTSTSVLLSDAGGWSSRLSFKTTYSIFINFEIKLTSFNLQIKSGCNHFRFDFNNHYYLRALWDIEASFYFKFPSIRQ